MVDGACEHGHAKTIKRPDWGTRDAFQTPPSATGAGTKCGVGRRGCGRERAAVGSTDEKDEICVRKN